MVWYDPFLSWFESEPQDDEVIVERGYSMGGLNVVEETIRSANYERNHPEAYRLYHNNMFNGAPIPAPWLKPNELKVWSQEMGIEYTYQDVRDFYAGKIEKLVPKNVVNTETATQTNDGVAQSVTPTQEAENQNMQEGETTSGTPKKMTWWEYYMPKFLGGASKEEVEAYKAQRMIGMNSTENIPTLPAQINQKLSGDLIFIKGVTVDQMRQSGFSEEKIQSMYNKVLERQNQINTTTQARGLSSHLEQNAQKITMTSNELGITKKEVALLQKLGRNT